MYTVKDRSILFNARRYQNKTKNIKKYLLQVLLYYISITEKPLYGIKLKSRYMLLN